ncbi:hypothetical protein E8E13_007497 [Curvularia kusanoi]|uniref:Uncharacterized protein n=1 Tax=Curvularia kusanoi TaxID=90978 RepID=A0A9P4TKX1_CURKU|nr:hypothetical protein E8E13_007497 [Curvularia kusanoi]
MAKNLRDLHDHNIEETNDQQEEIAHDEDDWTDTEEDEDEEPCSERNAAHKRPADGSFATPNPSKKSKISSSTSSLTPGSAKQPWKSPREGYLSDKNAVKLRKLEDEIVDPNRELSSARASKIATEMFRDIIGLDVPPVSVIMDMRKVHIEPQGRYSVQLALQNSGLDYARWECAPVMKWMGTLVSEEEEALLECKLQLLKLNEKQKRHEIELEQLEQMWAESSANPRDIVDSGWRDEVAALEEELDRSRLERSTIEPLSPDFYEAVESWHEQYEELEKKYPGMFPHDRKRIAY